MERVSKAWFSQLNKFTQDDWETIFLKIKDERVRAKVARIIFWDFFDDGKEYERIFTKYLKRVKVGTLDQDVFNELAKIYPVDAAKKRLGL